MPAASARLSSTKAGARPVALTVKVRYEMICGYPGQGRAIVELPRAAFVPTRMRASAVLVNGESSPSVDVAGHDVSIALPPRPKGVVSCMIVGPGTLTMTLTRTAGLGNPKAPGTYVVRVRRDTTSFRADVAISA